MDWTNKNQSIILPGTGRKVDITFNIDNFETKFINKYGYDIVIHKPDNVTYEQYQVYGWNIG